MEWGSWREDEGRVEGGEEGGVIRGDANGMEEGGDSRGVGGWMEDGYWVEDGQRDGWWTVSRTPKCRGRPTGVGSKSQRSH